MHRSSRFSVGALFVTVALTATACGSDPAAETTDAASGTSATAVAEGNAETLATNDDVRLIEVLEVDTGEITTLTDTVTGDRPVLLWFWAPH
ncbi:MAG: hypothetical protein R2707_20615 [Acidimicrobiales bacterium]